MSTPVRRRGRSVWDLDETRFPSAEGMQADDGDKWEACVHRSMAKIMTILDIPRLGD